MKNIYITFSGDRYHDTTGRIVSGAPGLGADEVCVYDDHWLTTCRPEFRARNAWAWDHHASRGFGWFIWKPLVVMDALDRAADGDVVLFTDADTFPIASLDPIYEIARDTGAMVFTAENCWNRRWCKRDCFIIMGQDEPRYHGPDVQCAVARFMAFKKGPWTNHQFMVEWLAYCCNQLANTFDLSAYAPEYDGFQEHRCEQAILTNLAHKYGFRLWREACEAGEVTNRDRDRYPQLFSHVNVEANRSYGPVRGQGSCFRNVHD